MQTYLVPIWEFVRDGHGAVRLRASHDYECSDHLEAGADRSSGGAAINHVSYGVGGCIELWPPWTS